MTGCMRTIVGAKVTRDNSYLSMTRYLQVIAIPMPERRGRLRTSLGNACCRQAVIAMQQLKAQARR